MSSIGTASFLPSDPTPYPHFTESGACLPNANCGIIIYRPILVTSTGDHLNTQSVFLNDKWDLNTHWDFNLGVRYDKNHAVDASGNLVSKDHNISPRLGLIWDVKGNGRSRFNMSWRDTPRRSPTATPAVQAMRRERRRRSSGPIRAQPINPVDASGNIIGTPVAPQQALAIMFAWLDQHCDSKGQCGLNATDFLASSYPGYTTHVLDPIKSPNVNEITVGFGQPSRTTPSRSST